VTRHVLFVQGGGADVHDRWDDKLAASLERELGEGYAVHYPRMPDEADPRYPAWSAAILRELDELGHDAILVGHSVGAAILIHAVAEHPPGSRLGGLFLVAAPFIGEGGWPSEDIEPRPDLSARLPANLPVFLYHGARDDVVPFAHVRLYAEALPHAVVRALAERDHQLDGDMSEVARDIRAIDSSITSGT
jgi:predicted alpha/beta hydrolase family esterase